MRVVVQGCPEIRVRRSRRLRSGLGLAMLGWLAMGGLSGAALPDGRRYEMVSPPKKNGGGVMLASSRNRASAAGEAFEFASLVGFGDVHGTAISTEYLSRRTGSGWRTHGITPQQEPMNGLLIFNGPGDAVFEGEFSADLSRGVTRANAFPAGDPDVSTVSNLFVRTNLLTPGLGTFTLVTDSVAPIPPIWSGFTFPPPPNAPLPEYRPAFAGASADFSHVIFESTLNLTQDAIDAGLPTGREDNKLYEWSGGVVRLVGVLPDGTLAPRSIAGQGAAGINPAYTDDTISDDGSRVFFTTPDTGQLYVREDGLRTVRVNASEKSVPDAVPGIAMFQAATPDGSRVFFTTEEALVDSDDNSSTDLYRADLDQPAGARLTRVSVDEVLDDAHAPPVVGVLGASTDGTRVYFIARGPLVPTGGPDVSITTPAIYLWDAGTTRFVAKLMSQTEERNNGAPNWQLSPKTSRVTPDGNAALFVTAEGDQTVPHDHGFCDDGPCDELYAYTVEDAGQGSLACVSCDPSGGAATGEARFLVHTGTGGARISSHLNRPLSHDGRFVFFHTPEVLLAEDQNDDFDVYEYDLFRGQLHLISSGDPGGGDAYFLDASTSGRDVFFATRERLVGWDVDGSYDAYDARVGGGFPEPVRPLPECVGRACQGEAGSAPGARPTSSRAFRGAGNVRAAKKARKRCKRGKVRKRVRGRVRCVKKKSKRSRRSSVAMAGVRGAGR